MVLMVVTAGQAWASVANKFSSGAINRLGRDEPTVKRKYGEPLSTEVSNIRNPHWPDVIDKTIEYKYEKISFLFYELCFFNARFPHCGPMDKPRLPLIFSQKFFLATGNRNDTNNHFS